MNTYLEDLIRDAQQRQAGRAVPPERILAKLPVPTPGRSRARRRGTLMVAAACAVGLAVAAVPVAVHLTAAAGVEEVAWSGTVPDFGDLRSPREVWPAAVHRIPDTLPGGGQYTVSAVLGGGRYLVKPDVPNADSVTDLPGWPVILDSVRGTAGGIHAAVKREGAELADVFAAGEQVLWGVQHQSQPYELWSAPLDGASPSRLLVKWRLTGQAHPIGVDGGTIYWWYPGGDAAPGVYRTPFANAAPVLVPGTEGYLSLGTFPWVSSVGPAGDVPRGRAGPRTGELLNVVSGERRTWTAHPDTTGVDCNPVVCVGLDADGRATVQRLDGTGFRRIPYSQRTLPYERSALGGRFGIGSFTESGGQTWIWDRVTGAAASVARVYLSATARMPQTVVQWEEPGGAKYVLDLAAVK
jgi:hypothetical protein